MTTINRSDLYELVWSEPMKVVAPRFGISDVALSKICRKHDIPRPPRGYWAKLAAGKTATKARLKARRLGMPRDIELDRRTRWQTPMPTDPSKIEIPQPKDFAESPEDLVNRVHGLVKKVTVPRDLAQAHHQIRRLLEKDEERRQAQKKRDYHSSFDVPLFDSPFERRRLRILNAIFQSLGRHGVRSSIRGTDPDQFEFTVGEQQLSFSLDSPGIRRYGTRWGDENERAASLPIILEIQTGRKMEGLRLTWTDKPGQKLERQLTEIVITMIVAGEMQYRLDEAARRERLIEHKKYLTEKSIREAEAERQRLAEERKLLEEARVDLLLRQASAFDRAETIRNYVSAAQVANSCLENPLPDRDLRNWAAWALAEADRIDPVLSGAFTQTDVIETNNDESQEP